jgi:hypothetical protein
MHETEDRFGITVSMTLADSIHFKSQSRCRIHNLDDNSGWTFRQKGRNATLDRLKEDIIADWRANSPTCRGQNFCVRF